MGYEDMKMREATGLPVSVLRKNGLAGLGNLLLAYINLHSEPPKMSSDPIIVQIEPTLHCNLKCEMCINPIIKRVKRHMTFTEFKKILDEMPFVSKISLVGAGEPLLNPDIFNMVSYAKSKGILIGFATNGMLLNDIMCRKIIGQPIDWVNISLDSADKEKYERIRKGADFQVVIDNIKRFTLMTAGKALPEISVWFVIMKNNLTELPSLIELVGNIGIKKVSAQLEHDWGDCRLAGRKKDANFTEEMKRILIRAKSIARKRGIIFDYVNIPDATSATRACRWPWKSCYITAEGFITPCCLRGSNPDILNFGNIFTDSFRNIWNNTAYRKFREALKSDNPPGICAGCTSYYKKI